MPRSYLADAARRRAARTGGSYQKALQQLTRFDEPHPSQPLTAAGIDWTPLYGVEATFANGFHELRGVVLPPDGVRPAADVLRVAVTSPHTGIGPAEVTYLDVRWWQVDPMPETVEQRFAPSRRKTRGPAGLPLYRAGDLPAAALATKTMLERQFRMRPAAGQEPVAEYLGQTYFDLFALDDAEPMAALSPERSAAWLRVRTCARCGTQDTRPLQEGGDDQRYCGACLSPAADEWWTRNLARAQELATMWARDLVADPNAVIAGYSGWPFTRLIVLDVATGTVRHDVTTALPDRESIVRNIWGIRDDDPRWDGCMSRSDVAAILASLARRRIITWDGRGLKPVAERLIESGHFRPDDVDPATWTPARGDSARRWYAHWLSLPVYDPPAGRRWASSWSQALYLRGLPRILDADEDISDAVLQQGFDDIAALQAMAAGTPTAAQLEQGRAQPPHAGALDVHSSSLADLVATAPAEATAPRA